METKLTLLLDKEVITQAKELARKQNISLSKLIETYLRSLILKQDADYTNDDISPLVNSLAEGSMAYGVSDDRKAYKKHLNKKYGS